MTALIHDHTRAGSRAKPLFRGAAVLRAVARMHLGQARLGGLPVRCQPAARAELLGRACRDVLEAHGFSLIVSGPPASGPVLYVANHQSYFDPVAILAARPANPIAKAEVAAWPGLGSAMRIGGTMFVDRSDRRSGARVLREAANALALGASVLAFPEGTTTDGTRLLPFQPGIFGLAKRSKVPIVPVAVRYSSPEVAWVGEEYFLPHYLRLSAREETGVHIHFGAAIPAAEADSADVLARRAQQVVRGILSLAPEAQE